MTKLVDNKVKKWFNDIASYHEVTLEKMHDDMRKAASKANQDDLIFLQEFGDIFVEMKNVGMKPYLIRMKELLTGEHIHTHTEEEHSNIVANYNDE